MSGKTTNAHFKKASAGQIQTNLASNVRCDNVPPGVYRAKCCDIHYNLGGKGYQCDWDAAGVIERNSYEDLGSNAIRFTFEVLDTGCIGHVHCVETDFNLVKQKRLNSFLRSWVGLEVLGDLIDSTSFEIDGGSADSPLVHLPSLEMLVGHKANIIVKRRQLVGSGKWVSSISRIGGLGTMIDESIEPFWQQTSVSALVG